MSLVEIRPVTAREAENAAARRSGARTVVAVATLVVVTVVAGLAVTGSSTATGRTAGLADAGRLTPWLLPVSRGLFDLAAIGTVGTLIALAWLVPHGRPDLSRSLRRAVALWAVAWAAAGTVNLLASVSQVVGVPLGSLPSRTDLLWYGVDLPQGRSTLLVVVVAVSLALWIGTVRSCLGLRAWAVAAPASLAPLLSTGHAATASNHFLATETLLVHVVAATLWTGGLLALVVHVRPFPDVLPLAVARFSRLALVCAVAVGASGLVGAWTRLGLVGPLWMSSYGALLLLKTGALVLVAWLGWAHRRHTIPALVAGRHRAFARLATVEVGLMAVTVGLAVVLARTAPPIAATLRAVPPHASVYPTVDPTLGPLTPVTAVTAFRHDALTLTAVVVALGLVLAWARATIWSTSLPGRRVRLVAGLAVALGALVGGPAAYSTALFSAQVTQILVLALVAPPLLVSGVPRWAQRRAAARLRSGRLRPLARPAHAVLALLVVLAVALQSPVLELSLRGEVTHLALSLAALLAGLLVTVSLQREPASQSSPPPAVLLVLGGVLAWYGVRMCTTATPAAGGWYRDVALWWSDPAVDQRVAGLLMVGAGVAIAVGWVVALRPRGPARPARPGPRRRPWGARS
jgi:putative copper export protein/cytochrome c oxidase assembly factor CtaG